MFKKEIATLLEELDTNLKVGLTSKQVQERQRHGRNVLDERKPKSIFAKIFDQINEPMIYILMVAAFISMIMHELSDAIIIIIVILLNAVIGLIQEDKAQKSLDALRKLSTPKTLVKRDHQLQEINVEDLVVGDIVIIESGRYIPADLRLAEVVNLKIDESILTGESVPVEKSKDIILENTIALGDIKNMAFMSSYATYGRGVGIVTATGMHTEIGKIASMLNNTEELQTPLQKRLAELGKLLGIASVIICILMFGIGVLQGRDIIEMLLVSISLAVAIIPEGLPAVITVVLALGVQRMIHQNAIVKKLPAVETLGSVNVICSDKTGTITQNKMTVTYFYYDGQLKKSEELTEAHRLLVDGFMLCNDANNENGPIGDPTEIALLDLGKYLSLNKSELVMQFPRIDEIPFDSDRKMMTTFHHYHGKEIIFTKGALDLILNKTTHILIKGDRLPINHYIQDIQKNAALLSSKALRVLALTYKEKDHTPYESNLTFIGLVGMIDPPREEVVEAVKRCNLAGIRTIMITGDHQDTAFAIAKDVGICTDIHQVMSGYTLSNLTQDDLNKNIERYRVFARVQPEHKVMIVKALQSKGYTVSMTGDGVNDAPSLKAANIGVAMGITGSDVSKEASSMILTDDNFATIVKAVEEGRNIYSNIKKSILYLLSCNLGEVIALFTAVLLNWATPLKPIHILWVNLVTDSLPALALGVDPSDQEIMSEQPRKQSESIFAQGGLFYLIFNGSFIALLTLILFWYGLKTQNIIYAQTMAFMVLSISQLFHSLNSRSFKESIFKVGIFKNKFLLYSALMGILLQISIVQIPTLNNFFSTVPLLIKDWLLIFGLSASILLVNELIKCIKSNLK
ncbi:calcium-translocating P-type ATPase, PMCA-type [Geosporobacter ferrireducens]|uniref:P-type Ca(2+) transporter n=1 Tax=Geosporobacter ferrireducens TaxID=1424294 RepID=A0A1D8GCC4_9FIRM|nr:calcium-translocating P-type ATPase, PMCA-type [Geosporobacter ferrireducens]AOT68565.1 calcium-translocating P-type ATPase, PMCA-type [Geosporobacter ferrireducens]MTI54033.1 calcium-translocating P-type ATPase, PMCA-type [Geosporobacter ferrireducens]